MGDIGRSRSELYFCQTVEGKFRKDTLCPVFRRMNLHHGGWFIHPAQQVFVAQPSRDGIIFTRHCGDQTHFVLFPCRTMPELVIITGWICSLTRMVNRCRLRADTLKLYQNN